MNTAIENLENLAKDLKEITEENKNLKQCVYTYEHRLKQALACAGGKLECIWPDAVEFYDNVYIGLGSELTLKVKTASGGGRDFTPDDLARWFPSAMKERKQKEGQIIKEGTMQNG